MESDSYDIECDNGFSWRQKHLLDAERPEENGPWNGAKSHPAYNEIAGEQSPLRRILCMTASPDLLFAGNTNSEIIVWDLHQMVVKGRLTGHNRSILSLFLFQEHSILFSSSSDNTIRVWDTKELKCLGTIEDFKGDIFCMHVIRDRLICGSQDTSIKVLDISKFINRKEDSLLKFKFMDCDCIELWGHCGFVFSLTMYGGHFLASGSGDGTLRLWDLRRRGAMKQSINAHKGGVYSLTADSSRIFSAGQDKLIRIWDSDTGYLLHTLRGHLDEILSLSISGSEFLFSSSADGIIKVWNRNTFQCLETLSYHATTSVALCVYNHLEGVFFSTGEGNRVVVWDLFHDSHELHPSFFNQHHIPKNVSTEISTSLMQRDPLMDLLQKFVSIQTVSSDPSMRSECWRGAKFLGSLFQKTGFEVDLIEGAQGKNPLVFARLGRDVDKPTVLIYGHYDIFPVKHIEQWESDPFQMTGRNGYVYGRGVTDDKGPILGIFFAAHELHTTVGLPVNILFIIEGEEECDSEGCADAILSNRDWWSDVDYILLSNSFWIGNSRPCLHYGLRGVLDAEITIEGPSRDLHSGVDGGVIHEPMSDLVTVLASITENGRVNIPQFYEDIRPVSEEEEELYKQIDPQEFDPKRYQRDLGVKKLVGGSEATDLLMRRWRQPTFSIHNIVPSHGGSCNTVIPSSVSARVSMRLVPDQLPEQIFASFKSFVDQKHEEMQTGNKIVVRKLHSGDWWIADPSNKLFKAAEEALEQVWGVKPLYTREGGTIPITSFLEHTMNAPAIHLPFGQRSDSAHLPNERIRMENLTKGKEVVKILFQKIAALPTRRNSSPPFRPCSSSSSSSCPKSLFADGCSKVADQN